MNNQMKKKLKNGEVVLGSWITISSIEIPEILSVNMNPRSGFFLS